MKYNRIESIGFLALILILYLYLFRNVIKEKMTTISKKNKKYYFGVIGYFKNERHILNEWILHYKTWGVDHIWLIDNGSEDNYDISEFVNNGFVTVINEPKNGQNSSYHKHIKNIMKDVKWLGVFDLDEFLYSRENNNLKEILKQKFDNKKSPAMIKIQMTIFFPATFESCNSIIEKNILRRNYDSPNHPKCIYNLDEFEKEETLRKFDFIHGNSINKTSHFIKADDSLLCINHYRYGSMEYIFGIKEGRGGGVNKKKYKQIEILKSLDDKFLSNDTYLRDNSFDVIKKSKLKFNKPSIDLYPDTSWQILKKKHKDKYQKFKEYETNSKDKILTFEKIYEISNYIQKIDCETIDSIV